MSATHDDAWNSFTYVELEATEVAEVKSAMTIVCFDLREIKFIGTGRTNTRVNFFDIFGC